MEGFGGDSDELSDTEEEAHEAQPWTDSHSEEGDQAIASGISIGPTSHTGVGQQDHEDDGEFAVEDEPLLDAQERGGRSERRDSHLTPGLKNHKLSSPIGLREPIGPGGGRRLSNALGHTNTGLGTGGGSFH